MKNLDVPKYKQTTDYSCGPACLRAILAFYDREVSEKEITEQIGTTHHGTPPSKLLQGAWSYGLKGRWRKKATIADLRRAVEEGAPVIVNWFSHDDGHYSVVVGVDDKKVTFLDPEDGKLRSMPHDVFMRVWFDFPSPHIEHRFQLRIRWMLALST